VKYQHSFFFILFFLSANVFAQQWQDTLKEVQIKGTIVKDTVTDQRNNFTAGQKTFGIEKIYKDLYESQSLANLLAQQSSVFVKSYGVNSMATLTLRGASAAQSSVLWNGVPILNPALGVADISLLRTGLFNEVKLQYGSSAALFGSGNVGGALMLDDEPANFHKQKDLSLHLGYGSYGRMDGSIKTLFQNNKFKISLNGFYQRATNDFSYEDVQGNTQHLANARLKGGGGLLSADYNLNKKGTGYKEKLYLRVWLQQYSRGIPPALFEQYSVKKQIDNSLRTLLGWEKNTRRSTWYAKGSYSREYLHYTDSTVLLDNKNTVQQYYQELGWKYQLQNPDKPELKNPGQHLIMVYAPIQYAAASGENISSRESQFRPALVAAYHYAGYHDKLQVNAAVRQEWVNGNAAPLLPGIGGSLQLLDKETAQRKSRIRLQLMANLQRTYRIPTLNELYYFPGGNPDLKPEQGWSQDGGYAFTYAHHLLPEQERSKALKAYRFVFTHELNFFNRNIQDWIYWLGGAIWTPHNIAKVHSRGMDMNNKVELTVGKIKLHAGVNYTYVLSTTEESYLPGDGSIGKQIPYTPRYNIQGNAGMQWLDHLFINYNQTYTGYRFVTVDESQYLEPYNTANIQASYSFHGTMKYLTISAQLQNVFNTDYEVVNGRPMPGRNFLLQAKLGLSR
jgi:iron complex outermembrane receptor protein